MIKKILVLVFVSTIYSCIDPFEVDIYDENAGGQLVVEGIITNKQNVQIIRINRSAPVGGFSGYEQVEGASVSIKDDKGNCFQLFESRAGVYITDTTEFESKVGRSYQLTIVLEDGVEYISDYQELKPVTPIDRLWVRGEREPYLAGSVVTEGELLNVYTNVNVGEQADYLSYDYEGVYELRSFLQGSSSCWDSIEMAPSEILPLTDERRCFKNQDVSLPLNIYSSVDLESGENINQKILSISPSRVFYFGYSMVVRKYSLTESYFNYLDDIKEQNSYGGDLFAPPPTAIVGNIHENGNDENRVLGFFTAVNSTSKRIFIDNQVLRDPIRDPLNRMACVNAFPIEDPPPPPPFCCDCLLVEGATDTKPDFWPY
ncbi:DUF4249 domain-containing protein [Marivirga tractuosa]|uniref:DUF4249 domain-containing protein n=1 Tax=Marivirga tractuosa TaxID=1006 RepID=UPI0035CFE7EA